MSTGVTRLPGFLLPGRREISQYILLARIRKRAPLSRPHLAGAS